MPDRDKTYNCKIVNKGNCTHIYINGEDISEDVTDFCLSQDGGNRPFLDITIKKTLKLDSLEFEGNPIVEKNYTDAVVDEIKRSAMDSISKLFERLRNDFIILDEGKDNK